MGRSVACRCNFDRSRGFKPLGPGALVHSQFSLNMETDYIDEEEFAWLESVCAEAEAKRQRRNSNSGGNLVPSVTAPAKQAPQLPVISFTGGHTFYLDDVDAISSAATRLSSGTVTTLGFDIVS